MVIMATGIDHGGVRTTTAAANLSKIAAIYSSYKVNRKINCWSDQIIVKHFSMSLWLGWSRKHSLCLTLDLQFITSECPQTIILYSNLLLLLQVFLKWCYNTGIKQMPTTFSPIKIGEKVVAIFTVFVYSLLLFPHSSSLCCFQKSKVNSSEGEVDELENCEDTHTKKKTKAST